MKKTNKLSFLASLLLTTTLTTTAVFADADPAGDNDRGVVYAGAETRGELHYGYLGTVFSVDGHDLGSSGWAVKALVGHGKFRYNKSSFASGHADGKVTNAEVEIGYEFRRFNHLFSVFLGPDYQRTTTSPKDTLNRSEGTKWGAQVGFEFITDPSKFFNFEFDASFSTANNHYHTRARPGFQFSRVRFGPELSFSGNRSYEERRGGLFMTLHMDGWSTSLYGGIAYYKGRSSGSTHKRHADPYAGISFGMMY
jgi:hypothetical protein